MLAALLMSLIVRSLPRLAAWYTLPRMLKSVPVNGVKPGPLAPRGSFVTVAGVIAWAMRLPAHDHA